MVTSKLQVPSVAGRAVAAITSAAPAIAGGLALISSSARAAARNRVIVLVGLDIISLSRPTGQNLTAICNIVRRAIGLSIQSGSRDQFPLVIAPRVSAVSEFK